MKKINKWLCKVFGHKVNDVQLLMLEIECNAIYTFNENPTVTCNRCGTTWGCKKD